MFVDTTSSPPRRQRVAAYAVIERRHDGVAQILLSRLAPELVEAERWTLPGGGVDFGEHPRDAVVREVYEETGLSATVGDRAWIDSATRPLRDPGQPLTEMHSVRMVFEGWVAADAPEPRVVEVAGSTVDARWHPLAAVLDGSVPTVPMVRAALAVLAPPTVQRMAAYAVVLRGDGEEAEMLLTRIAGDGFGGGAWHLPGGGIDHGEAPEDAVRREVAEEAGLDVEIGDLLGVHDVHVTDHAPSGRLEDFHGVHLVYAAVPRVDGRPRVTESGGTTDAVAWMPLARIRSGDLEITDVVRTALAWLP